MWPSLIQKKILQVIARLMKLVELCVIYIVTNRIESSFYVRTHYKTSNEQRNDFNVPEYWYNIFEKILGWLFEFKIDAQHQCPGDDFQNSVKVEGWPAKVDPFWEPNTIRRQSWTGVNSEYYLLNTDWILLLCRKK